MFIVIVKTSNKIKSATHPVSAAATGKNTYNNIETGDSNLKQDKLN